MMIFKTQSKDDSSWVPSNARNLSGQDDELQELSPLARRQVALSHMRADLQWLLAQPPHRWEWTSTKRDLVELVDTVWKTFHPLSESGYPMTRSELVNKVGSTLGVTGRIYDKQLLQRVKARRHYWFSLIFRYEPREGQKPVSILQLVRRRTSSRSRQNNPTTNN